MDGLRDYLQRIGRVPLLTPAEELHLGGIVQEWLLHPSPSAELRRRGLRARNRMVAANLRLVVRVCRGYLGRLGNLKLEDLDLLQAGNIGLIRAVEKFDPSRGYRLSTYAIWWIQEAVKRFMAEYGHLIRMPRSLRKLAHRAQLLQAGSDQPLSREEIASRLGEQEQRLASALSLVRQCSTTSLDKPAAGMGEDTSLIDLIRDPHGTAPQDDYLWLHEQLDRLALPERRLLRLRYGQDEPCSFAQAAQRMGLAKGSAQSLERRALRTLRLRLSAVTAMDVA